jgi:hypothetical protein
MLRKSWILLVTFVFFGYGTLYAAETLEKAIEEEAAYIVRNSGRGSAVAIVSIKSGSNLLSEYIMERLPDYVIDNRRDVTFVDRTRLDLIQKEIDFQYSGEVSDETMVSIGKMIGAQVIVAGSVMEAGNVYNFNIKLLKVETGEILGSNSVQIIHDNAMEGFMSNSRVAQMALAEAQQKRQRRDATVSTIKNALGIFSNGFYLGSMGALNTPVGISLGWLDEGSAFFIDTSFGPPSFKGYEHPGNLSYKGNDIQDYSSDDFDDDDFKYVDENDKTAFLWDMIFGLNFNIIKTLLWADIGIGFEYKQNYKLYSETSASGSNKIWIQDASDLADKFKVVVSAGLYIKLWYFYIQGKYKYIVGEELDMSTYGLNHLGLGVGYVWRKD